MHFKAEIKDGVLKSLLMAQLRAAGFACAENSKKADIVDVKAGGTGMSVQVTGDEVSMSKPSFLDDFVYKNPASRILSILIVVIAIGAFFLSLELLLSIPIIIALYFFIFWKTYQKNKAAYEIKVKLYKVLAKTIMTNMYLKPVIQKSSGGGKPAPAPRKAGTHPAIKVIFWLMVLFCASAYIVSRELLIFVPILGIIYFLISYKLYREANPKPKKEEPKAEKK